MKKKTAKHSWKKAIKLINTIKIICFQKNMLGQMGKLSCPVPNSRLSYLKWNSLKLVGLNANKRKSWRSHNQQIDRWLYLNDYLNLKVIAYIYYQRYLSLLLLRYQAKYTFSELWPKRKKKNQLYPLHAFFCINS